MKNKNQIKINLTDLNYKLLVWSKTDPDNHQYGRQLSDGVFQFKEFDRNNYEINTKEYGSEAEFIDAVFNKSEFWEEDTIVLANFNDDEIRGHVSAYYDSLEQLKEIYGKDSNFIIAECIFEQQSGMY